MTLIPSETITLLSDIRRLILEAKSRAAMAINAELTLLYWQVGRRIHTEILKGARAEYGKQIVATLSKQLTGEVGKGWSEKQLLHCLRIAETFPDEPIFSSLRRELSWTHLKTLIYIDDPLNEGSLHRDVSAGALVLPPVAGEDPIHVV